MLPAPTVWRLDPAHPTPPVRGAQDHLPLSPITGSQ
jgi:hypothetical protein